MSHYCISKASVRALTDSIRREPLNTKLKVILVEPTIYRTRIVDSTLLRHNRSRVFADTPDEIKAFYGQRYFDSFRNSGINANAFARANLDEVVDVLVDAVTLAHPPVVYWCCGWFHFVLMHLLTRLPEPVVDFAIKVEQTIFCRL